MTEDWFEASLSAYMDGELAPGEFVALERHLADCSSCSRSLAALRSVSAAAREAGPKRLSGDLDKRLRAAIAAEESARAGEDASALPSVWDVFGSTAAVAFAGAAAVLILVWTGPRREPQAVRFTAVPRYEELAPDPSALMFDGLDCGLGSPSAVCQVAPPSCGEPDICGS